MSGHEHNLRTENDDRGDGQVGPSGRKRGFWQTLYEDDRDRYWYELDMREKERDLRAALDRINLGLHTSADVALLRRELNL